MANARDARSTREARKTPRGKDERAKSAGRTPRGRVSRPGTAHSSKGSSRGRSRSRGRDEEDEHSEDGEDDDERDDSNSQSHSRNVSREKRNSNESAGYNAEMMRLEKQRRVKNVDRDGWDAHIYETKNLDRDRKKTTGPPLSRGNSRTHSAAGSNSHVSSRRGSRGNSADMSPAAKSVIAERVMNDKLDTHRALEKKYADYRAVHGKKHPDDPHQRPGTGMSVAASSHGGRSPASRGRGVSSDHTDGEHGASGADYTDEHDDEQDEDDSRSLEEDGDELTQRARSAGVPVQWDPNKTGYSTRSGTAGSSSRNLHGNTGSLSERAAAIYANTKGHAKELKARGLDGGRSAGANGQKATGHDLKSMDAFWEKQVKAKYLLAKKPDPVLKEAYKEVMRREKERLGHTTRSTKHVMASDARAEEGRLREKEAYKGFEEEQLQRIQKEQDASKVCKTYKNLLVARNEKELEAKREIVANELNAINKLIDSKVSAQPYQPQYSTTKLNIMQAHQSSHSSHSSPDSNSPTRTLQLPQGSHSNSPKRRQRYQQAQLETIKEESRPHSLNSTANLDKERERKAQKEKEKQE